MTTLRQKAWLLTSRSGGITEQAAPLLRTAPLVDVSAPALYFLEDTPPEETFSVADVPLAGGLGWLVSEGKAVFVEAGVESGSGLEWGALLTPAIDSSGVVEAVRRAAEARDVEMEYELGEPGLIVMEPGVVERAGALIYLEDRAGVESNRVFYETLFGERLDLEELWGVLQVACYAELCEEAGAGGEPPVIEPGALWYLPLGEDGRVIEVAGDSDELMLFAPGVSDNEALEDVMDFLADSQRQFLLALLFSLGCMGAAKDGRSAKVTVSEAGEDAVGAVRRLEFSGLNSVLASKGSAGELGLAHALTVCRAEFEVEPEGR